MDLIFSVSYCSTLLTSSTVSGLLTEKCYTMNSKFRSYCSLKRMLTNPSSDEAIKSDCAPVKLFKG